jgi:PAS domain S-box-containing protein
MNNHMPLPQNRDQAGTAAAPELRTIGGQGQVLPPIKASILIVDDKPNNLFALAQMLDGLDENIVQATSGADALRCLLRQDFAIVLVDIQMPDMDGYELATLIRERDRSRHMPIIFITAYGKEDQDISRGYALGAVDYVFKPIDPIVLRAKVSVFVDLFKKTEAVRQQAEFERRLQLENLRVRTEKIEAERALRQIEERQSLIIRSLPIALYTADLKGRFSGPRFLSDNIAEAVGFAASAFIEDPELWSARILPADLRRVLAQVASIVDKGKLSIEYRWRCADGSERVFLDQAVLIRDDMGAPKEIFGTCLDVTYRRQLEQQLLQSQKMEAIGQLTGGIAHDFNNMLSVIIWNLDAVSRTMKGTPGKVLDRVQMALNGALNCAELIRQLLTFARHQPHQAKVIEPTDLIPRVAKMLNTVIGEQIKIGISVAEDTWPIFADPAQVESALMNLAINARDAMSDGGTLVIECTNILHDGDLAPPAGEYVMLSVTDTGEGMPSDVLERAFEPFFTTKGPGQGSGLGLSMVYGFARQCRGHVRLESKIGIGTTVRIYLPRSEMPIDDDLSPQEGVPLVADTDRVILVVEDDADVRSVTIARLEDLGYQVHEADSAASALKVLSGDQKIDLLFTDVVMPGGMNGIDLAGRALELRTGLKVLFASGYASTFHTTGNVPGDLLQKPYRDEDLRRALNRMFAPAGEAEASAAAGR